MNSNQITPPSFFLTYWRPWEEKNNIVDSFLDYARDTSISKYTSDSIGKFIQSSSIENISAINNLGMQIGLGVDYLGDTIKKTSELQIFELTKIRREISGGLSKISDDLFSISLQLDLMLARLDASNLLLRNIEKLLRVSDSEKERQRHVELGLKFFISADIDEDLYEDSLNEFLKAEKLMPQDYFTLYYIGIIYLLSPKHINVELANTYFSKSGKYGFVEGLNDSMIYENVLDKDSFGDNKSLSTNKQLINKITSSAYEKTAYSYYILGNYISALKFQKKALDVDLTAKNYFLLAKYQIRNSTISDSCNSVLKCLELEPKAVISILSDLDLISSNEILDIVKEKNNSLNKEIDLLITDLLAINYLDSNEYIKTLKQSKEKRFDIKLENYFLAKKRKQEIIDFIRNEEKEKKRSIDLAIELKKENDKLNKYKAEKLLFFQEYTHNELYYLRLCKERDLILGKVEQIIKEEALKAFFSISESLNASEQVRYHFPTIIRSISNKKGNGDFKSLLREEFLKFKCNDENLKIINNEFNLDEKISQNIHDSQLNYLIESSVNYSIEGKVSHFNKIINVSKGLDFIINSPLFIKELNEKKNLFYGDSTTKKYYLKYLDLAITAYKNEIKKLILVVKK